MKNLQKITKKYYKISDDLNQLTGEIEKAISEDKDFNKLVKDLIYYSYCSYRLLVHNPYYRLMEEISRKQIDNGNLFFDKDSKISSVYGGGYNPKRYGVSLSDVSYENLDKIINDLEKQKEQLIILGKKAEKENDKIKEKNKVELLKKIGSAIEKINPILNEKKKSEKYEVRFDDDNVYFVSVEGEKEEKMNLYRICTNIVEHNVGLFPSEDPNPFINITNKMYTKFNSLFRKEKITIIK